MARGKKTTKGSSGFNRKISDDFLLKNQGKPGVLVTDSGLQILEIEAGSEDIHRPTTGLKFINASASLMEPS